MYGGIGTMWLRILIAGIALIAFAHITRRSLAFSRYWRSYLLVGLLSSAVPFSLIGFAMKTLPASYGAMLNALSPFFGVLFAVVLLGESMSRSRIAGLVLGATGVAMIVQLGPIPITPEVIVAASACVAATVSYGYISVHIKKHVVGAPNLGMAGCSLLLAALATAPVALITTTWSVPSMTVVLAILALALVCSAVAYLLYYKLIADIGPTKAISVTFLIPVFGVMWGMAFLDESLNIGAILGGIVVLCGVTLVLQLFQSPARQTPDSAGVSRQK